MPGLPYTTDRLMMFIDAETVGLYTTGLTHTHTHTHTHIYIYIYIQQASDARCNVVNKIPWERTRQVQVRVETHRIRHSRSPGPRPGPGPRRGQGKARQSVTPTAEMVVRAFTNYSTESIRTGESRHVALVRWSLRLPAWLLACADVRSSESVQFAIGFNKPHSFVRVTGLEIGASRRIDADSPVHPIHFDALPML